MPQTIPAARPSARLCRMDLSRTQAPTPSQWCGRSAAGGLHSLKCRFKSACPCRLYPIFYQAGVDFPVRVYPQSRQRGLYHRNDYRRVPYSHRTAPEQVKVMDAPKIQIAQLLSETTKDCDNIVITVLCVSVTKEIPCFEREKSTIVEKFNCFLSLWAIAASIPDTLTL